jgi:hypothetical protein
MKHSFSIVLVDGCIMRKLVGATAGYCSGLLGLLLGVRTGQNWAELGRTGQRACENWAELGRTGQRACENWAELGGTGQKLGGG